VGWPVSFLKKIRTINLITLSPAGDDLTKRLRLSLETMKIVRSMPGRWISE
jgi:hypothetical protein